jgi:hypothetical protein
MVTFTVLTARIFHELFTDVYRVREYCLVLFFLHNLVFVLLADEFMVQVKSCHMPR